MGLPCVGLALFDGVGPLGALSGRTPHTAQNHHRLGLANDPSRVSPWMRGRRLVVVADGTSAVLAFVLKMSHLPLVNVVTRLRLDACLYDPAPVRAARKRGRQALKGKAQPKLASRLTDPTTPWKKQAVSW